MYVCRDCFHTFDEPDTQYKQVFGMFKRSYTEDDYDETYICPKCASDRIEECDEDYWVGYE